MRLAGTCLYVDNVPAVLEFYRRAFGFQMRFFDEAMQFAELDTGGAPGTPPVLGFASHQCGEMMMPGG
jgi:lactoylglutathione lyase